MRRLLVALFLCMMPAIASAVSVTENLSFSWSYDAESEAEITGFEIYQLVGTLPEKAVISKIPATARFATGPITYDNAKVNRYYIRAYNDSNPEAIEFSGPSNTYRQHVAPGQFKRK